MASIGGQYNAISRVASGNLNFADPAQYRFVLMTGQDVHLASASGQVVAGVLKNSPQNNEHATVVNWGHAKVSLGSSLGQNAAIMTNDTGFAVLASSGGCQVGRLLSAANSGLIAEAFITIVGTPTV